VESLRVVPVRGSQEAAPLADGGGWALLYILLKEGLGVFVYLAGPSRALFGREGISSSDAPSVALDRGEAHVEQASSLGFWHTPLYGGDYLLAEVF
jgi:hypothetical protein